MAFGMLIAAVGIVLTLVISAGTLLVVYKVMSGLNQQKQQTQRLLQTGVSAQARVLQIGAGGMEVTQGGRRSVQTELVLEVQLAHAPSDYRQGPPPPYQVQTKVMVPEIALSRLSPGATVQVRVDPQDLHQLAVDFPSMGYLV